MGNALGTLTNQRVAHGDGYRDRANGVHCRLAYIPRGGEKAELPVGFSYVLTVGGQHLNHRREETSHGALFFLNQFPCLKERNLQQYFTMVMSIFSVCYENKIIINIYI